MLELDARWTEQDISDFIDAAAIFLEDTDFMDFYDSHQRLYDRSRKNLDKIIKNEDRMIERGLRIDEGEGFSAIAGLVE